MPPAAAHTSSVQFTERLVTLYPALVNADDRADAPALAALGWELFGIASMAQQAHLEAGAQATELCVAARVVTVGRGSPASLDLLRTVLARYGWLPRADATPLQVLAASRPSQRLFRRDALAQG